MNNLSQIDIRLQLLQLQKIHSELRELNRLIDSYVPEDPSLKNIAIFAFRSKFPELYKLSKTKTEWEELNLGTVLVVDEEESSKSK